MSNWISALNGGTVSVFGSILAASFCSALGTSKKRKLFFGGILLILALQIVTYSLGDMLFLRQIYPLIVHLPLLLLLYFLTGKFIWPFIAVMTAYLCCQLRRWMALLIVATFGGGDILQEWMELIFTLPILFLLLHYLSPIVQRLSAYSLKIQLQFGFIPILYYCFDYLTRIYSDLLASGSPVVVEFMPFVCCGAYLVFLFYNYSEEAAQLQMQQQQKALDIQLHQAVREINALRESQELARRYRHDLRHHLQYVSSCIANEQNKQAQGYISGICKEIEAQRVQYYCDNEMANLIFSAFVERARKAGINMNIHGNLSANMIMSESDLCVLLSNILENAIHACQILPPETKEKNIEVTINEQNNKIFLQVINPCQEEVPFKKGIPVSNRQGHGIGVQSICAIVNKYNGVYDFSVKDGKFILRLSV